MNGRSDPQKVVIKNAHDDIREHNAHGERRVVDEHNAHGFREDNNHQVVAENEPQVNVGAHVQDEVKNLKGELEKMKKEKELERMQFEKLGIENEQLKKDFEVLKKDFDFEGLKSENVLLKAEKQFGIDLKTLSNEKQKIEDELKIVEKEKGKLVEENKVVKALQRDLDGLNNRNHQFQQENTKLKADEASARDELKVLKMQQKKSQTEIERVNKRSLQLETEKNKFENLYQTAKREKEEVLQEKKKMQGQLNDLKEANKRLQNDNQVQNRVTTPVPVYHPIHRNKQPIEDFLSSGLSMVLQNHVFCEDYKKWVSKLELKSYLGRQIKLGNVLLIKKQSASRSEIILYPDEIQEPAWSSDKIKCVKLLHRTDNTRIRDMTFTGLEWESRGDIESFGRKSFSIFYIFLILVIKN